MSGLWQQAIAEAQSLHHKLHRQPALSWAEHTTAETIRNTLSAPDILRQAFTLISSNDGARTQQVPCHSPHYDFNDVLIAKAVQLYAHLAGAPLPTFTQSDGR